MNFQMPANRYNNHETGGIFHTRYTIHSAFTPICTVHSRAVHLLRAGNDIGRER